MFIWLKPHIPQNAIGNYLSQYITSVSRDSGSDPQVGQFGGSVYYPSNKPALPPYVWKGLGRRLLPCPLSGAHRVRLLSPTPNPLIPRGSRDLIIKESGPTSPNEYVRYSRTPLRRRMVVADRTSRAWMLFSSWVLSIRALSGP